jgi:5-methylcytosine-specific restriction endonuclease McrA
MAICAEPGCPEIVQRGYCERHRPHGRASRSPSTQAQDPEYRRNRLIVLAGDPPCHWCGKSRATTVDHLLAVVHGGSNRLTNLVPACVSCNCSRKANPDWTPPARRDSRR